eukprot:TRINITY_DN10427_c1_g1_i1.p1 TRINITY_DN10427_c1_g1~~TRINITY_DN10427_c1_g1_i1.p1  ORF type:complete len:149 (-),score=20.22 TRINITY_DN10427_c1_g1_i1:397-843(-)
MKIGRMLLLSPALLNGKLLLAYDREFGVRPRYSGFPKPTPSICHLHPTRHLHQLVAELKINPTLDSIDRLHQVFFPSQILLYLQSLVIFIRSASSLHQRNPPYPCQNPNIICRLLSPTMQICCTPLEAHTQQPNTRGSFFPSADTHQA